MTDEEREEWLTSMKAGDEVVIMSVCCADEIGVVETITPLGGIDLTNGHTYNPQGLRTGIGYRQSATIHPYTEEYKQQRALEKKRNTLYYKMNSISKMRFGSLSLEQLERVETVLKEAGLIEGEYHV